MMRPTRFIRFLVLFLSAVALSSASLRVVAQGWGTYLKPFSAQSPWNSRPVQPVLGSFEIPKSTYFPAVSEGKYSTGVFLAAATDQPVTVLPLPGRPGVWDPDAEAMQSSITIPRWPEGVVPARGTDAHADIVDPAAGIVHSFYKLSNLNGQWRAAQYAWTRLDGRGWGEPGHYFQGARAAAVPTMGGLIRKHEINDGDSVYRHALAVSLSLSGLSPEPSYIFPATSADSDAAKTNIGRIPEGALLMLPASYDSSAIANPHLRKVVETLKLYGAYVVDKNTGTPFAIYVENGSSFSLHGGQWNSAVAAELNKIRAALRQVLQASRWIDGNGATVDLQAPLNLLSLRGPWSLQRGSEAGKFESWQQAVVFPASTERRVQVNTSGRSVSTVSWARPVALQNYRLTARTSGGALLRLQLLDDKGSPLFDSGELPDGREAAFAWPADVAKVSLTAISGDKGRVSTVSGSLMADSKLQKTP
jgi:hypothetical protein